MTASIKVLISFELSSPVRAFGQERGQNEGIQPAETNEMKDDGSLKPYGEMGEERRWWKNEKLISS